MTFQTDVPQHADLAARLAPIRAHFIGTLKPRLARLEDFFATYATAHPAPAVMRQLQEDAHKMRGVAPTLGFEALGRAAGIVDELLEPWHASDEGGPVTDALRKGLAALHVEIKAAMTAV